MAFAMNTVPAPTKGTSSSSSKNTMSDSAMAAMDALIAQLLGGGTAEQRQQAAERQKETENTRKLQSDYSKSAAFADAQGAMAAQLRAALEALLPSITKASEGSGTSQSSMRALLLQKAAMDSADKAALLGLNTATSYGQISANLASILANLTAPNSEVTNSLIAALGAAKGSINPNAGSSSGGSYRPNAQSVGSSWSQPAGSSSSSSNNQQPAYATDQLTYYPPSSYSASDSIDNATWSALMHQYGGTTDSVQKFADALGSGGWNNFLI